MTEGIRVHFVDRGEFSAEIGESVLDVALRNDVPLDHACGGVCACSTCHIKVQSGADSLAEASDDEEDQLDTARDISLESRLACQCVIEKAPADGKIEVAIPTWNVNLAQEGS